MSNLDKINRLKRSVLEYRIRKLESLLLEGKRDQEILNNFLGDEYYNKYQAIKNKIKDPEYKDIYKLIKKDPNEVKDYIDSFQSNTDARKARKSEGAKLIYQDDLWKVYRITTYKAAQLYGSGTTWCITGRYSGHEERGEDYFYSYINDYDLDGGYYFYIKNDGKTKYCLLREDNGTINSLWNAEDNTVDIDDILVIEESFPSIDGIFVPPRTDGNLLFRDSTKIILKGIENGEDINGKCLDKNSEYYGYTPLIWHMHNNDMAPVILLLKNGAKITKSFPWQVLLNWFVPSTFKTIWNFGLSDIANINEMLEYAINNSSADAIKLLLKLGADPNARLSDGNSVLYHEITRGYGARVSVIRELIKNGADKYEILDNGKTLLDLAKRTRGANNPKILALLE